MCGMTHRTAVSHIICSSQLSSVATHRSACGSTVYDSQSPDKPNFHCRGRFITNDKGEYSYVSLKPTCVSSPSLVSATTNADHMSTELCTDRTLSHLTTRLASSSS